MQSPNSGTNVYIERNIIADENVSTYYIFLHEKTKKYFFFKREMYVKNYIFLHEKTKKVFFSKVKCT